MNSSTELVTVLTTWVTLALLLFVLLKLWPSVRLDAFRQSMFGLRDEMFDYAASGNIGFNDPAYLLLRKSMNGFIRYAHNLTFFRMNVTIIYWTVFSATPEAKWSASWDAALARLPSDSVRQQMQLFHQRSMHLVANRLVLGSPVLIVLLICVVIHYGVYNLTEAVGRSLAKFMDPKVLEEEAARVAA
ncbi:MAG: hypothetical protein ACRD3P_07640 [Terriglobales bacterium]